VDERAVFCPACGAPQIRVPLPSTETQEPALENEVDVSSPASTPSQPAAPAREGIQWKVFFSTASPLAALTGFLAFLFSPLTVLVVLPLSLRRIISRYRPYHPGMLRSGQGARLGAFMALLSFAAFLIFFLATLSMNRGPLLARIHELATQNPDPQVQQALLWFTSNTGFIVITGLTLMVFFILFEIVGMISGAIMAPPKNRV
jgi:hypothetical protein